MKVLALSFYAPPQLTPQAIQIGRQLYHLDADVALLHSREAALGDTYDQYPDFFQRIRGLEVPNPGPRLKGLLFRAARRLSPTYDDCPDLLGRWRTVACRQAMEALPILPPDVIASFGMPMSDHLVALKIKRQTGLPWLAHFSDPWVDNPFYDRSWLSRRVNALMERQVIAAADQVIFTSERTLDLMMRKYPPAWRDKAAVLPHAWDMDHFSGSAPTIPARLPGVRHLIRYIGNCYGGRTPLPLFRALNLIERRNPALLVDVSFQFVGYIDASFHDAVELTRLRPGLVTFLGQVGYRESLLLAKDADALLVIDADSTQPSVFLPSKLIEYIGVRRPVWGITPPGTSADLIAEWADGSHASAPPADPEAVARMLEHGLISLAANAAARFGPEVVYQRFSPAAVSGALKEHLSRAISACCQACDECS